MIVFLAAPAWAKCQPGRTNNGKTYFAGWTADRNGSTIEGVYSHILNYSPWVNPGNDVSAWTMLVDSTFTKYAQVGWQEYAYGKRYSFAQWNNTGQPGKFLQYTGEAKPTNTVTKYTTWLQNGYWVFRLDADQFHPKVSAGGVIPKYGEIYGETHTLADQMPGATMMKETMLHSNLFRSGSWEGFNGSPSTDYRYFSVSVPGDGYTAVIWDNACTGV